RLRPKNRWGNQAPLERSVAIGGESHRGGDVRMLAREQDRRMTPSNAVSRQGGKVLVVYLVGYSLETIGQLNARLHEAKSKLVVFMAIQLERRVEGSNITKHVASDREIAGVNIPEPQIVSRLSQSRMQFVHLPSTVVYDWGRSRVIGNRHGTHNRSSRPYRVRIGMGSEEVRDRPHVIVQKDNQASFCQLNAGVARRSSALVRLPGSAESVGRDKTINHLAGTVVGPVDRDDHLVLGGAECLASERFQRPAQ